MGYGFEKYILGADGGVINTKIIDVNFDFTNDTPGYWKNFWEKDDILGGGENDPDTASKMLQSYHQKLWSKPLPNGEILSLSAGSGSNYLTWRNFRFGSDSLIASFRYRRYRNMLQKVADLVPDYKLFIEVFLRKSYTVGGTIIFPKENSINRERGCNPFIKDRWDLTLECIRRYYNGETSPLFETLKKNKEFFSLFVDFRGYVDFFHLQDCVTKDYKSVVFWIGEGEFDGKPLPKTPEEYIQWMDKQLDFLVKRNERIRISLENAE